MARKCCELCTSLLPIRYGGSHDCDDSECGCHEGTSRDDFLSRAKIATFSKHQAEFLWEIFAAKNKT